MFLGRKNELSVLESTYKKKGFKMTVIYGRRRIGKSFLINEFIKDKRATYYSASQTTLSWNVQKWSEQFIEDLVPEAAGANFDDPERFLRFIATSCKDKKTIIALDEISYMAEGDASFLSILQNAIDNLFADRDIYLIICGSAVSFMENEILSEKSPLFGRRSNQIFLKPFDYIESAMFVPKYSYEEKAIVYGVTGGVAKYLSLFDDRKSLDDNLIESFFKTSGYLYEEATNLMTQEFRNIASYNAVIEACSAGANKLNEIAEKTKVSTASLTYILKSLAEVGIISRIVPITDEKNKKKTRYEVTDGMFRFWYKFIPSARAAIELNKGETYYYANVKGRLHDYMGEVFEDMCRHYTLLHGLEGRLNCPVTEVGVWWGTDPNKMQTDIDVVGIDKNAKQAVLGECKFRNEKVDKDAYEHLMERKGLIDKRYTAEQYLLFSLSGFSKWVVEHVDEKIRLISIDNMYQEL